MPAADIHAEKILILDFGSQTTQLIARRIRELGVYCEIHPWDVAPERIAALQPLGVVLSGGPESTLQADAPRAPEAVFALGVPILGICYGMQTLACQLGGSVVGGDQREFGHAALLPIGSSRLFDGLVGDNEAPALDVWMSHGDRVEALPPGFAAIAATQSIPVAAMADEVRRYYGVQFHPEVTHTARGSEMLRRFVFEVCGASGLWTPERIVDDLISRVREQVGDEAVLLGLSGGVDSSVVAALLARAIGERLICLFVDTGLLRRNEGDQVMELFAGQHHLNIERIDASERFFAALRGVDDPEQKRKIIGAEFIAVFEEAARRHGEARWLAQGTIYPDVIESAAARTGKAHVIKSHHNVGGLPERMHLKLVEPLRELFKDEVRRIGETLGLPHEMVHRHPFPGPGLGVRVLGVVDRASVERLQLADAIFLHELREAGWYDRVAQAFAVLLPVRSVGVVGDARAYEPVVALRAVETIDFMTAHWARLPHDLLDRIAHRIVNEVRGVSRVVYDISGKPPATIEWE